MRPTARPLATALSLVLLAALSCAAQEGASPGPAAPDEAAVKAAEDASRRAQAAATEAARAEEDAVRARRRALLESAKADEDLLDLLRRSGRDGEARVVEARLQGTYARLGRAAPGVNGIPAKLLRPAPAVPAPVRAVPFEATRGLPLLAARTDNDDAKAVRAGLDWLARHQSPGGYWDCDGFSALCREGKCPGAGGAIYDPGATGLATLAFLGNGETHKSPGHGENVRDALKHLKAIQDAEGCFGPRTSSHFTYNHALATLAMCEAYGLSQSPLFKESAQKGVDFIEGARNPYLAWRYGVQPGDNDTSMTSWMVMALKSARGAGLSVSEDSFKGALAWIDKVTEPEFGRVGYTARGNGPARPQELMDRFPAEKSESLTAAGVLTRIFCGATKDDEFVRKGAALCMNALPRWDEADGSIDLDYWYFGTLAMFQVGGDNRRRWLEAMDGALLPYQRGDGDGCARGSWDPVDPWGSEGGRVYSTALCVMMEETRTVFRRVAPGDGK